MCVLKYIVSHTITRFYTIFDNKKYAYILSKCNKGKIIKIHHWSPEIIKFF